MSVRPRLAWRLVATHLLVALTGALTTYLVVRWLAPALFDQSLRLNPNAGQGRGPGAGPNGQSAMRTYVASSVQTALLVGALAGTLVATLVGVVAARHLVRPVQQLRAATHQIAQGRYRDPIPRPADRELADLAADIEHLGGSLAETETRRTRLLGEVAHEMRTPLTVIDATMEALTDGVVEAGPAQYGQVQGEVRRLRRLAEDLSALSRAEEGRTELRRARVDVRDVVMRAVERLRPQADDASITLTCVMPDTALPAEIDGDRVAQIVTNLVGNALRATPAGGSIRVGGSAVDGAARIEVADTGEGIDPADLERIFERFYRAASHRPREGGSGIGLTLARSLAEAHGGTLTAASAGRGQGATFTVTLPLAR